MRKKITILTLGVLLLALCMSAQAQQPTKVQQIGYLSTPPLSVNADRIDAFRQGLRELGYVEGKNIIIEWRSAEGKEDRLPTLATELVRLKTDVIVTAGAISTRAAKAATSTIPIVMAQDPDPVGNGFVASLAQPGGKITGLSRLAPEISGKQLELLKETIPRLSRVGVLGNAALPGTSTNIKGGAARRGGIKSEASPSRRAKSSGHRDFIPRRGEDKCRRSSRARDSAHQLSAITNCRLGGKEPPSGDIHESGIR
jgi:putative tryptophan/tyrosine transport system substrate-binding protein